MSTDREKLRAAAEELNSYAPTGPQLECFTAREVLAAFGPKGPNCLCCKQGPLDPSWNYCPWCGLSGAPKTELSRGVWKKREEMEKRNGLPDTRDGFESYA